MKTLWKALVSNYTFSEHLQAMVIGFLISTVIIFPLMAGLINALLVYVSFIYLFLVLINFTLALWVFLWAVFYFDSLIRFTEKKHFNKKQAVLTFGSLDALIVFIIGLILILTITPTLL